MAINKNGTNTDRYAGARDQSGKTDLTNIVNEHGKPALGRKNKAPVVKSSPIKGHYDLKTGKFIPA